MPIYEFVCADCGQPFEQLVLSSSKTSETSCPTCHSQNVTKKISTFASHLSGLGPASLGGSGGGSCNTGSV